MPVRRRWPRRVAWLVAAVIVLLGSLDFYTHLPSKVEPAPLAIRADTRDLIIVIHGSFGADDPSVQRLHQRFLALAGTRPETQVVRYVWAPHANTFLRAAARGQRVGDRLGGPLAALPLRRLHLVAHSAGAYLLDPLCEALRKDWPAGSPMPVITMTFLDPIGIHGLWETHWGAQNHGRCADYAEAWLNFDDAVRATNEPLARAWNIDVTGAPARQGYARSGHAWPVDYYAAALQETDLFPPARGHSIRRRGGIERR